MNELVEQANAVFQNDRFATDTCGAKIQNITPEEVICTMDITEKHLNAAGTVMGGAIFTLADFTFAIASNFQKTLTVSLNSQISYLGVAKGKQLISHSECIKEGRTTCFYLIHITDDLGNQVADVTITGYIKNQKVN